MSLRVLAVSAPQFPSGALGTRVLSSADPVSLYNACRLGAMEAAAARGTWGDSNLVGDRRSRQDATLLLHSLDDLPELDERLSRIRPNLLLIGAMTICFPGAIAVAKRAREILGDQVCVVLGGRHVNETIFEVGATGVGHHPGSPLLLMANDIIDPVFDVAVSGDGEAVIRSLGDLVGATIRAGRPAATAKNDLASLAASEGRWIAGAVTDGSRIETLRGRSRPLDYGAMLSPAELFGVRTRFDSFDDRPTAQVFSDVGRGCIYDCAFCSEARSTTGAPNLAGSPERLFHNIAAAARVIHEDNPADRPAAFCEDSTFLAFAPDLVRRFADLMAGSDLRIQFGGQLTIDQILSRPTLVRDLKAVGLRYLFVGLETFSPDSIGGMSKDVGRRSGTWIDRAERAFEILHLAGVSCGVAVLFGLGETHSSRLELAERLLKWQCRYGFPSPISLNWAVQHPLNGRDGGASYTYVDWSVPEGPFLEPFRHFGEASIRYPMNGMPPPRLSDLQELQQIFGALNQVSLT